MVDPQSRPLCRRLLDYPAWRHGGIVFANPILENAFVLLYGQTVTPGPPARYGGDLVLFLLLTAMMLSYGYLLNDAVDRDRDLGHRQDNPFFGAGTIERILVVASALLVNLLFLAWLAPSQPFLWCWLAWFVLATAYSLPGIYLKGRGLAGLVAVTLAQRTLPGLLALLFFPPSAWWEAGPILAYLTLRGLGADLSHQLTDHDEDRANHLATYGVVVGPQRGRRQLVAVLRLEILALVLMNGVFAGRLAIAVPGPGWVAAAFLLLSSLATAGCAEYLYRRRRLYKDPHVKDYGAKDVFYLIHKSYPKVVLPGVFLALLCWHQPVYLWLAGVFLLYCRAFSWQRIKSSFRLFPTTLRP